MIINQPITIVAHRGDSYSFPENTLVSMAAALETEAPMIEIDLHMTRDNQLVVIHDEKLNRTCNRVGYVRDYTLAELKQYDFGIWRGRHHSNQRIMTFKEILAYMRNTSRQLLVELKLPHKYPSIERQLISEIRDLQFPYSQLIIQSFDFKSLKQLHQLEDALTLGVLLKRKHVWKRWPHLKTYTQICDYINPHFKNVTRRLVKEIHRHHAKVMPYTVNRLLQGYHLYHKGVDGLITDRPQLMCQLMERLSESRAGTK